MDLLENKVTLAVPEGNPKGIESFDQLAELLKSGDVMLAMGNSDVPVGQYTHEDFRLLRHAMKTAIGRIQRSDLRLQRQGGHLSGQRGRRGLRHHLRHGRFLRRSDGGGQRHRRRCAARSSIPPPCCKADKEDAAQDFLAYLQTDAAMTVFESVGFSAA